MDSAAFMTLPASSFSPMPKEAVVDPEEIAAASSPYTTLNGSLPHTEGERRRKEMLDVATMLEERYRVLLPPDRVRRAPEPMEAASTSQVQSRDGDDSETERASTVGEKLRLRLPARSSTSTTPAPSPATIKKPRFSVPSKQSSIIRIVRTVVPTPSPPLPTPFHAEDVSPLSPSPTFDMDMSSASEPPSPPLSPIPTAATVLPQTPISNQVAMVEPSSMGIPLSDHAAKVSEVVSGQPSYSLPEQERPIASFEQEIPATPPDQDMLITPNDQEMLITPNEQEMLITPDEQEMLITPDEQERLPTLSDQERQALPEPERSPTPERPIHDQEMLPILPEQERLGTPEPERRSTSPEQENLITLDQERLSVSHAPDGLPMSMEREESIAPDRRSLTPIIRDKSVTPQQRRLSPPLEERSVIPQQQEKLLPPLEERPVTPEKEKSPPLEESPVMPEQEELPPPLEERSVTPEQEKLPPPLEEKSVTPEQEKLPSFLEEQLVLPEQLPTPPVRERATTPEPEPQRLPTPPVPEGLTTPLVDVTDQDLQDSLPEEEPSTIAPHTIVDEESERAEMEEEMSVRAEIEVPVTQNEPENEVVDVETEADKMDVEQDETIETIPTLTVIEQDAIVEATMDTVPETEITTVLPVAPITQEPADSGPMVIKQADVPVYEVGLNLDRPVTPEPRPRTESVDIEGKTPSPMPISSISAPRRGRKKARLDPSVQLNETVSAPVRGPRVPKNHVTYIGASGEMEVTASAIIKAAVHRTQRDVTRHLNAFGVPVPNAIVQMGPDFELPEWVFPPLSPAESEHEQGDLDSIEILELDPSKTLLERQVTPADQAGPKESMEDANGMNSKELIEGTPLVVEPIASIRQFEPT